MVALEDLGGVNRTSLTEVKHPERKPRIRAVLEETASP